MDFVKAVQKAEQELSAADLEYRLHIAVLIGDGQIRAARYLIANRERLLPQIVIKAIAQEVDAVDLTNKFCRGVAERFRDE